MAQEWLANSTEDLGPIARSIIHELGEKRKIALYGEMGAGKTTFVKAFGKVLGIDENIIASPTFSIINEYRYSNNAVLNHMDLYRLKNTQEALDIGIEELLYDDSYALIEWPQLIVSILPDNSASITIEIIDEHTRKITLK